MLSEPFNYINDLKLSIDNNKLFWDEINKKYKIKWDKKYDQVLYKGLNNKFEWFKGGQLNACYNSLDINLNGFKDDEIALVHEVPIKQIKFEITYRQLFERVCVFSRALKNLGIQKGDYVMVYLHNSFEAVIAMLSCARIGAIHNVIYSGTLVDTLVVNIEDCKPKLIITSTFCFLLDSEPYYYLSVLKEALDISDYKPNNIIIYNRKDIVDIKKLNIKIPNSLDWDHLVKDCEPLYEYMPVESNHPLYLIYTSGTTNKPKGIIRDTGGHTVALNYITRVYYGLKDGDTFYSASNFGWICSHTYLVYGCLMVGSKSVFLEGPYKDLTNDMWDIIDRNQVNAFLITPSTSRKLKMLDPNGKSTEKYNLSSVRHISIGSERVDKSIQNYLIKLLKKDILVEYWQSESGYQITFNDPSQMKIKSNSIGKAVPGYKLKVLSTSSGTNIKELGPNEIGELVIELPLPPCFVNKLFNDDQDSTQYSNNYMKYGDGYYATGDLVYYDSEGYYYFISRVNDSVHIGCDTINCSVIESEILNNPYINDCSIIGIKDEVLNEIPLVLLVIKNEILTDLNQIKQIKNSISNMISNIIQIGLKVEPIVQVVDNLPKNRNGKSLKPLLKSIFNNQIHKIPSNIDNINIYYQLLNDYKIYKINNNK